MTDAYKERKFIPVEGNPFGLVYKGALTENAEGSVNIHGITYPYRDFWAVANVYTPAGYDPEKSYPAVVVAHPNGGMKDQVAGNYAQRLAENGYIALAFDAAYQGESGGEPRCTDRSENRVEDIHRATDIILQYPGVDRERVATLGICGGGGYTFKAAVNAPVRELLEIPGATHIQTYWKEEYVDQAMAKLVEFFGAHL